MNKSATNRFSLTTEPVLEQPSNNTETYLAFDFGLKKIGVAIGDSETKLASALSKIASIPKQTRWNAIEQLINKWKPQALVVGISRNMDGTDHEVTHAILKFSRQLEGRFGLPVIQVDETLSSYEAWGMLHENPGVTHAKALKFQDQIAAQLILQSWLDQQTQQDFQ